MRNFLTALFFSLLVIGFLAYCWDTVPVVQKSARTGKIVACASKDTNWQFVSGTTALCQSITSADVEWVP